MEFGHVKQYLKVYPEANRVLLLNEIASGAPSNIYMHRGESTMHQLQNICI